MNKYFSALVILFLILSIPLFSQTGSIESKVFSENHNQPISMRETPDGDFILIEKGGNIKLLSDDGEVLNSSMTNIEDQIGNSGGERGLLGLAIHPDYKNNGFIYVNHTDLSNDTRVARYTVTPGGSGPTINPGSRVEIYSFDQPFGNHNGGDIHFGPDGYLYIATGDGGSGGDPQNNAQDLTSPLGKILRIDIDSGDPFSIPADNPFLGNANALDEIWTYGWRNPWRFSFDRATGDMWVGDVGQNEFEEIDTEAADSEGGLNYGWRCYEGFEEFNTDPPCDGELVFPYYAYGRDFGCSVTGGYVFHNDATGNELYIYGDFCTTQVTALVRNPVNPDKPLDVYRYNLASMASFAQDSDGNIYGINLGGTIYSLTVECETQITPDLSYSGTVLCGDSVTAKVNNLPAEAQAVLLKDGEAVQVDEEGEFTISEAGNYQVFIQGLCRSSVTEEVEITETNISATAVYENEEIIVTEGFSNYTFLNANGDVLQDSGDNTFTPASDGTYTVIVTDSEGCMTTIMIEVISVALSERDLIFKIYPQPANDQLFIDYSSEVSISNFRMYNLSGSEVPISSQNGRIIYIANLPKGVYILEINSSEGMIRRKIIKD